MASTSQIPFHPAGLTVLITAATSPPAGSQVGVYSSEQGYGQYRIVNAGLVTVFLGCGGTAAEAQTNAAVVSSTGKGVPLLPGAVEILRFINDGYFSAGTASSTASIYITPGYGL